MTNHLQKCHKDIVANEREKSVKEHVRQGKSLDNYLNLGGLFLSTYLKWVVMTYQPITTCEGPHFRAMCSALNSSVAPLGRAKVTCEAILTFVSHWDVLCCYVRSLVIYRKGFISRGYGPLY